MDKNLLYIGSGLALVYFLTSSKTAATALPAGTAATVPSGVAAANYTAYPNDPNLLNPNYQLTPTQLQNYYNNYLELRQAMPDWLKENPAYGGDLNKALQDHWRQYGCSFHWTFYPLTVPDKTVYVPPPSPPDSGGSWLSSALKIAGSVVALVAGPNTNKDNIPPLTMGDMSILQNGSIVAMDIVPMFVDTGTGPANGVTRDTILDSINITLNKIS